MSIGKIESVDELRTFVAVVESGSLVAAAARVNVSPNAVSRRLSVLEERVGCRLVHRTTRKMSVSDEGTRFYERCRRILDELEHAEQELAQTDGMQGTLRIGVHGSLVGPMLLSTLGTMLEEASALRIQLHIADRFIEPIGLGLDLAIYFGTPPPSALTCVNLGSLVWSLFAAPSYIDRRGLPKSPQGLVRHECLRVLRDREETSWELTKQNGKPTRWAIGGRFETTDGRALSEALYAGIGIGVQLKSSAEPLVQAGVLVPVLPSWRWASTTLFALLPPGRSKLRGVRTVLESLKNVASQLA